MSLRAAWALAPLLLAANGAAAQGVLVAPHAVYIDHARRSGAVLLYNPNTEPVEVTISTLYGYPVTDSLGRMRLHIVDAPDTVVRSAVGWLQAFPRRLTVAPNERQTVRLLATPPPALADGEYWARLVIAAKGGRVPISGLEDTTNITVGLTLEVRTIIGVSYRKGTVHTGLTLGGVRSRVVGDSLETRVRLERRGSAAFVGTLRGTVVDSTGAQRAAFSSPLGVYYTLEPRFAVPIAGLPAGTYRVRVEVTTDRDDLAPGVILPAPAVRDSVAVRLP